MGERGRETKCFEVKENSKSFSLTCLGYNVNQECVTVHKESKVYPASLSAGERGVKSLLFITFQMLSRFGPPG